MAKNSNYTAIGGKDFLKLNSATLKIYYSTKKFDPRDDLGLILNVRKNVFFYRFLKIKWLKTRNVRQ